MPELSQRRRNEGVAANVVRPVTTVLWSNQIGITVEIVAAPYGLGGDAASVDGQDGAVDLVGGWGGEKDDGVGDVGGGADLP